MSFLKDRASRAGIHFFAHFIFVSPFMSCLPCWHCPWGQSVLEDGTGELPIQKTNANTNNTIPSEGPVTLNLN